MFRGVEKLLNSIFSATKLFLLLLIVLVLPRLFLFQANTKNYYVYHPKTGFKLGLENISVDFLKKISPVNLSFNIALITNQTGKNQHGTKNIDILLKKGFHIKKIFTPENSIFNTLDNISVLKLNNEILQKEIADIDILVFDMQDCGLSHDIPVNTLLQIIEIASQNDKAIIILDRPNLLGHNMIGPLKNGNCQIPVRSGMTIGELALFYNKNILEKPSNLHVIPMKNYKRNRQAKDMIISRISPKIKNLNACYCHSFLNILEQIKPFHLGSGTNKEFECLLLPDTASFSHQKWRKLHKILKSHGIENNFYRHFDTKTKNYYSGLQLKINNISNVNSLVVLLEIINFFKKSGIQLEFSKELYQSIDAIKIKEFLEDKICKKTLQKNINQNLNQFFRKASSCFLYTPYPKVEYLDLG